MLPPRRPDSTLPIKTRAPPRNGRSSTALEATGAGCGAGYPIPQDSRAPAAVERTVNSAARIRYPNSNGSLDDDSPTYVEHPRESRAAARQRERAAHLG